MSHDFSDHLSPSVSGPAKAAPVKSVPKISITVSKKTGSAEPLQTENTSETLAPIITMKKPAVVKVMAGKTINQGNYNSAKIDIGIEMPCDPAEIDECFEHCFAWVSAKMDEKIKENS